MKDRFSIIRAWQSAADWRQALLLIHGAVRPSITAGEALAAKKVMLGWKVEWDMVRQYVREHAPELLPLLPPESVANDWFGLDPDRVAKNLVLLESRLLAIDEVDEVDTLARMLQLADENAPRIIAIAGDASLSVDDRLRAISDIDKRFFAKRSPDLATLLNTSDPMIRKTTWWKVDRKEYLHKQDE